jgi:hypothetical protein
MSLTVRDWDSAERGWNPRQTQLGPNDGQLDGTWRIFLEHNMPDPGVPNARQVRALAGDHYETLRIGLQEREVREPTLIDDNYSIQIPVRPVDEIDFVGTVTQ